jgi:hypothetical protein
MECTYPSEEFFTSTCSFTFLPSSADCSAALIISLDLLLGNTLVVGDGDHLDLTCTLILCADVQDTARVDMSLNMSFDVSLKAT